jgi:heme A synthase
MANSNNIRRLRGAKKRLGQLRLSTGDRWLAALIVLICLLAIAAGAWLGFHYSD